MMRLDQLLVSQGLANSRTRSQRLIRHGRIRLADGGSPLTKASAKWPDDTRFAVEDDPEERYASRAGLKLEAVLTTLAMRFDDCVVLDIGQSTGGFTDCALRYGARHVIGVEVGHGQLAAELHGDPRVTCLEGLNARAMSCDDTLNKVLSTQPINSAIMDVSFISQTLILPEIAALLPTGGHLISLVKPQFELNADALDKRGVVRDVKRFSQVEANIRRVCDDCGLTLRHWQESPITGGDGNREFLLHAVREA
ncbi:hemolysin A [Halovibrio variabilis]|uniref:Hemolysin A n=1 Tax=Halovibrio variabilis TaxID=31910 RepID=A0A511UQI7_9GAMM|nr:TlyA family RNA methyltransferase [Halovibrio variabilis]GEN28850.1 hemolysin A [Halovibrio variabilis]